MPRPPGHPSGAKQPVGIRLSPAHITRLDALRGGLNRSDYFAHLIDQVHQALGGADTQQNDPDPARAASTGEIGERSHPTARIIRIPRH